MIEFVLKLWPTACAKSWRQFVSIFEPHHDKTNNVAVRPAKTRISLGIRPVRSESSLSAWRKLGSLAMPRLIWVFAGSTVIVGFVMRRLIYQMMVSGLMWRYWGAKLSTLYQLRILIVFRVLRKLYFVEAKKKLCPYLSEVPPLNLERKKKSAPSCLPWIWQLVVTFIGRDQQRGYRLDT